MRKNVFLVGVVLAASLLIGCSSEADQEKTVILLVDKFIAGDTADFYEYAAKELQDRVRGDVMTAASKELNESFGSVVSLDPVIIAREGDVSLATRKVVFERGTVVFHVVLTKDGGFKAFTYQPQ